MPPWGAATYTVRLNPAPGGNVTVSVANGDTSAVTVALTFSTTTWNTAQTVTASVTVNVQDNDAGLEVSPQAVTVGVPSRNVLEAVPGASTFTTGNWNTVRAVTVRADMGAEDADGVDASATVTHTVTSADTRYGYGTRTTEDVAVTIEDNDTSGVAINPTSFTVQEDPTAGGGTNRHVMTYTVVLDTALLAGTNIGVGATSGDLGALTVATANAPF